MKKIIFKMGLLGVLAFLLGCARSTWQFKEGNEYPRPLGKVYVIMKGEKETDRFYGELERALLKHLHRGSTVTVYKRLLGSGRIEGEKATTMQECERMRCSDILLISLDRKAELDGEGKATEESFFVLRANLVDPILGKPTWRAQREMDPADIVGLGLGLSIEASRVTTELVEQLKKEKLLN